MASITWSGNFNGTSAGPSGKTATITSSSLLPSNASITSITCSVNVSAGWTNTSFYWTLHWFHVLSGSTTGAHIGTIGTNNSAGVSYQCSYVPSGGANRNVTATLSGDSTSIFKSNYSLTVNVKANIPQSGSPTTYMNAVSVTVNYSTPSLNAPTNFKISGSTSYTGTFGKCTWTAASWASGSGTISYRIKDSNGNVIKDNASSGYYLPSSSSYSRTYHVEAYCTNPSASASSGNASYTYSAITTPSNVKIGGSTSYTGASGTVTWNASAISGTESSGATITYEIWNSSDGVLIGTTTSTSYTISGSGMSVGEYIDIRLYASTSSPVSSSSSGSTTVRFIYDNRKINAPTNVKINGSTSYSGPNIPLTWTAATSTGLSGDIVYTIYINGSSVTTVTNSTSTTITSGVSGYSNASIYIRATRGGFTSGNSNTVTFTYVNPDKTVKYFNGSSWVDCVIYYFNGSSWVKCDPYYFDGSTWKSCSTR